MKEKLLKAGEKKMPTFQLRHEVVDIGNRSGWSALIRNWCIMEDMEWSEGRIILDTSGCRFPFLSYASGKEWEERIHFWEFVLIRIIIIPMSSPAQAKRGVSDASCVCVGDKFQCQAGHRGDNSDICHTGSAIPSREQEGHLVEWRQQTTPHILKHVCPTCSIKSNNDLVITFPHQLRRRQ